MATRRGAFTVVYGTLGDLGHHRLEVSRGRSSAAEGSRSWPQLSDELEDLPTIWPSSCFLERLNL